MNGTIHIVGCGGVGSWLAPSLCLLTSPKQIVLHDGDVLEPKNLNRQLFTLHDIGRNKAEALADKYGCGAEGKYFAAGNHEFLEDDWIICCADNNPARMNCIMQTDNSACHLIVAANEKTSAEAYYHDPDTDGIPHPLDYYPEIETDHANDPRAAAIGCTGEAQQQTPQLVSANFMAASLAQWLFVLWAIEVPKLDPQSITHLPYKLVANASRLETHLIRDYKPKERTDE